MGFLSEGHRCPGGVWVRLSKALLTLTIGASIGTVLVYAMQDRPVPALWLAGAALGAVLAISIRQAIGVR